MKFLILVKNHTNAAAISDPILATKAARDYLRQQKADGLLDCVYQFASGSRSVAIAEADSAEELWESLSAYPLSPIQDYEIHPLTDVEFAFEKHLERLEAAMKV